MGLREFFVIGGCSLCGVLLWYSPRTIIPEKKTAPPTYDNQVFSEQLNALKKEYKPSELASIYRFEKNFMGSKAKTEKIVWLDSLIWGWDQKMRPGISVEYAYQKAQISGNSANWFHAGKRFLGLCRYFRQPQEKQPLADKALECFERAKNLDSLNTEIDVYLGIAYTESGSNPMRGITMLKKIAEENPENFDAQFNLGIFSMQSGQFDKAAERFSKSEKIAPENYEVKLFLADALIQLNREKEAIRELLAVKQSAKEEFLIQEAERRIQQIQNQ